MGRPTRSCEVSPVGEAVRGERARRRERRARALGVAAALAAMGIASYAIHWPAPGVSAAIGLVVWWLVRPERS